METAEAQDTRSEQERMYYEAIQDINQVIKKYTTEFYIPIDEYVQHPYSFAEIQEKIRQTERIFEEITGTEIKSNDRAFIAGAIIRYIDDFLDNYLWGYVRYIGSLDNTNSYAKNKFTESFHAMLQELVQVAQKYDAWMPDNISELPILEMKFEINPTQEFFDEHISEYIDRKAYDLLYLQHLLLRGEKTGNLEFATQEELEEYRMYALYDVQRDIANEDSYDFDIFRHIRVHGLDPKIFRELINTTITNGRNRVKNLHVLDSVIAAQHYVENM